MWTFIFLPIANTLIREYAGLQDFSYYSYRWIRLRTYLEGGNGKSWKVIDVRPEYVVLSHTQIVSSARSRVTTLIFGYQIFLVVQNSSRFTGRSHQGTRHNTSKDLTLYIRCHGNIYKRLQCSQQVCENDWIMRITGVKIAEKIRMKHRREEIATRG